MVFTPAPTQVATKPAAPVAGVAALPKAVLDLIAASNAGNVATALAAFADHAVVKTPFGLWVGKPQIAEWLKAATAIPIPTGYQVNGDTVIMTGTVSIGRLKHIGVDPVAFRTEYLIEAGKIRFLGVQFVLTSAQQAQVKQAAPQAVPPAPIPQAYIATIDAATSNNFLAALAAFADNAVVRTPTGLWIGTPQIALWLKASTGSHFTPVSYTLNGDTVLVTGTVSMTQFKQMGLDPVAFRAEFVFEGRKIRFFAPMILLTPEQRAKVAAASAPTPKP
jgi:hypothetical protein